MIVTEDLDLDAARRALSNISMLARRQIRRHHIGKPDGDSAAWESIVRFCESAGIKASILRESGDPQ